jgi:hypothetical protein
MTIINLTASHAITFVQSNAVAPLIGLTSVLGDGDAVFGLGLTLGFGSALDTVSVIPLTASNTITFGQTNARDKFKPLTASSTLTFTQTNARAGSWSPTAGNTITFGQSHVLVFPIKLSASNSLTFTQAASSGLLTRTASNELVLSHSHVMTVPGEILLTASNSLTFAQTAAPGLLTRTATTPLTLTQSHSAVRIRADGITVTASNAITFAQSNARTVLLVTGFDMTASNTLTFTQRAIFPIELSASSSITFTHSNDSNVGKSAGNTIEFTQTVVMNVVRGLTAGNTINFTHGFTYLHTRNGLPISTTAGGDCDITQHYSPLSGGGASLVPTAPLTLIKHSDVFFFFPSDQKCSPTFSLILRTPNFGDRDRNQYNRVNRESRGGALSIFRDPKWPAQRSLVMDFSAIKDSEVDDLLLFLEDTLGQEIGFRDWQGREWTGIIVTPDAAVTRTGTNRNDIAIELEVDDGEIAEVPCP